VFQNYALYPHMTIAENMGFSLRLAKKSKAEITTRVTEAARILGLADYLDRFPKQLSGGQRQRVAMGRAIVRNPQVFLFDEPLSNLDAKLRVQMRAELKDIHHRLKTTTVYVTHDQIEAMTMADRIVVMRDGVVEQVGAPLDLYDHPVNMFVAGFIGSPSMNFITGRIEAENDQPIFVSTAGARLPVTAAAATAAGSAEVVYGIRPEHLSVAPAGTGIAASVAVLEPTGSETMVIARLGEDQIVALLRERIAANIGDAMPLRLDPAKAHLFDAATGQRLG
jgi:multiple sugar transport system ATP-binding protein